MLLANKLGGRKMDEEKKSTFDAYMKIVEASNVRRASRESFEWKLSIAFWTLIVLATQANGPIRHRPLNVNHASQSLVDNLSTAH
jgi:hypothetical protein